MLRCIRVNFKGIKWRGENTAGVREIIIPSQRVAARCLYVQYKLAMFYKPLPPPSQGKESHASPFLFIHSLRKTALSLYRLSVLKKNHQPDLQPGVTARVANP